VDVHVHGAAGADVLDGAGAVATVASYLPRWGVTSFCPTTVACAPEALRTFLSEVGRVRATRPARSARVLPAHLESNFINPDYKGAQPAACLRTAADVGAGFSPPFSADDILSEIDRHCPDVGIITMAPEIAGGMSLVKRFKAAGLRVSLGHSGATFEQAQEAIAAGACHATHLFNRMSPMTHREPGLAGAVLASDEVAAELICDGHHVHPSVMRVAIGAKGTSRVMAITDGTAGSGLPRGSRVKLGGQEVVTGDVAKLMDGTLAGSCATMDRIFATLVTACGLTIADAAELCSTTPARELGLHGHGVIAPGAVADLVVLDPQFSVKATWLGGTQAWP
jgi:N-acetylglucosamine-6-phosphate deacetylase